MKKTLSIFLAGFVLLPSFAVAQTIYNSSSSGGSPLYNSPSSYTGGSGPISLKQLLEGNKKASVGRKTSNYYGGGNFRPYGADNNNYALSLSPQEIRESRARRNALAQQREREHLAALEASKFVPPETNGNQSLLKNSRLNGSSSTKVQRKVTSKYKQRDDSFEMPKKVFNSLY